MVIKVPYVLNSGIQHFMGRFAMADQVNYKGVKDLLGQFPSPVKKQPDVEYVPRMLSLQSRTEFACIQLRL